MCMARWASIPDLTGVGDDVPTGKGRPGDRIRQGTAQGRGRAQVGPQSHGTGAHRSRHHRRDVRVGRRLRHSGVPGALRQPVAGRDHLPQPGQHRRPRLRLGRGHDPGGGPAQRAVHTRGGGRRHPAAARAPHVRRGAEPGHARAGGLHGAVRGRLHLGPRRHGGHRRGVRAQRGRRVELPAGRPRLRRGPGHVHPCHGAGPPVLNGAPGTGEGRRPVVGAPHTRVLRRLSASAAGRQLQPLVEPQPSQM
ncbi:hypothetical protein SGPA1_11221 [Streptomyces misionensis JCM 4497]